MIILPAIDLKDGKVVRLYQGDFATVHQVARDPLDTARAFYAAGARQILHSLSSRPRRCLKTPGTVAFPRILYYH